MPPHAFSETDRLTARPPEFRSHVQAQAASACWRNWSIGDLTPHDGLVRRDHPVIRAILDRTQSATSLNRILRNPLGFVWRYGLRWHTPESGEEPLGLDPLAMGDLVHRTLDLALRALEAEETLSTASAEQIAAAVDGAAGDVAQAWESERAVPPAVIWRRTLDDVRAMSIKALTFRDERMPGARAFGEVPFGGAPPRSNGEVPWDPEAVVEVPGAGFRIGGYIDRLDISVDNLHALVRDYKTGRLPRKEIVLNGGRELQRCLYAFAVRALLGDEVNIDASLHYLRNNVDLRLEEPDVTLDELAGYRQAARAALTAGSAVLGPDTGKEYDDLDFALPANAGATYRPRKEAAARELLGDATRAWEAE